MNRAVFIDRNTIVCGNSTNNKNNGSVHIDLCAVELIKLLNQKGYKIVLTSNQADVARGLLREDLLQAIDKKLQRELLKYGAYVDAIYYCPHHPDHGIYPYRKNCECRKPNPGLIKKAALNFNLDLSASFIIGDKPDDIEAGKRAGIRILSMSKAKEGEMA